MDRLAFEKYLTRDFTSARSHSTLGVRTAATVSSRCLRVETGFGIELDEIIKRRELGALIERLKGPEAPSRLNYRGPNETWFRDLISALQKYEQFRRRHPT
jgi:hypothetical protein